MIESGFDNDNFLEFHDVLVNISSINGYSLSALEQDDLKVLSTGDYITLHSFALCDSADCDVISGQSAAAFDSEEFINFMVTQFMLYFDRELNDSVSGDARRLGTDSTLSFSLISVGATMTLEVDDESTKEIAYFVLLGVSASIAMLGVMAMFYEKAGSTVGLRPKV